jgi:hypothetical protein
MVLKYPTRHEGSSRTYLRPTEQKSLKLSASAQEVFLEPRVEGVELGVTVTSRWDGYIRLLGDVVMGKAVMRGILKRVVLMRRVLLVRLVLMRAVVMGVVLISVVLTSVVLISVVLISVVTVRSTRRVALTRRVILCRGRSELTIVSHGGKS